MKPVSEQRFTAGPQIIDDGDMIPGAKGVPPSGVTRCTRPGPARDQNAGLRLCALNQRSRQSHEFSGYPRFDY
jgi:hypothetical protein